MDQINLIQGKGGQGTSVTACAVALRAAGEGRTVRLDGHDHHSLAAIVGMSGDGPVIPGLILGASNEDVDDLVVDDGPAPMGCRYWSPGRALDDDDIAAVLGLPVIGTVPVRADIARAVDAGVLADRLPDPLATAASQILRFSVADLGREVA